MRGSNYMNRLKQYAPPFPLAGQGDTPRTPRTRIHRQNSPT